MTQVIYRHRKRGTTYTLVGYATFVSLDAAHDADDVWCAEVVPGLWHVRFAFPNESSWARAQCDDEIGNGDVVVIYRSTADAKELWVRPIGEFEDDNRFEVSR